MSSCRRTLEQFRFERRQLVQLEKMNQVQGSSNSSAGAGGTAGATGAGAELLVAAAAVVLVDAEGVGLGYTTISTSICPLIKHYIAHLRYHQYQKILLFDCT
jgi:hypothetical protein